MARLNIQGDVSVNRIVFSGGAASRGPEIHSPAIPFSGSVFGAHGATPGKLVQISAEIPHHCGRFEIDLQDGPGVQPNNLPFCFNVRFDDPHQGQAVVRVNRAYGSWGAE